MANSSMIPAPQVRSFRDLEVWRQAVDLAVNMHRATMALPLFERFELGRALRRSAVSVPSYVAEGFNRHSRTAYRSHVGIALGSAGELETQLEICVRLDYFNGGEADALLRSLGHVGRLLQGLWRSLE